MVELTMGVMLLSLTGFLWVAGAILQWHNIRRQEKLIARLMRRSGRRAPEAEPAEEPVEAEMVGEYLRPAKRWTVG
jgi:hypothetical protein